MPGNDSYTKLLLHCDGSDGSTSFIDSSLSGNVVTANGDCQIDTAQYKFGTASALFDGTTDYLSIPDSDNWNFGTGDFTIDFWVQFNSVASSACFYSQDIDGSNRFQFIYDSSLSRLIFYVAVSGTVKAYYYGTFSPSNSLWYHIALVRNGSNLYIFINGSALSLTVTTAIDANDLGDRAASIGIGYKTISSDCALNGWIDEYRISKGIARWTSNFTPPLEEYRDDFLTGYTYRKKLSIDFTKVDATLTDFTVLVKLDVSNFDFTKTKTNGSDIVFTSSDKITQLKFERVVHDNVNLIGIYYVKVPSISNSSHTLIYLYYGNSSVSDSSDTINAWDNSYKLICHMKDITTSTILNSKTGNFLSKTSSNNPIEASGTIYKAQNYDNSDDITPDSLGFSGDVSISISARIKINTGIPNERCTIFGFGNNSVNQSCAFRTGGNEGTSDGQLLFYFYGNDLVVSGLGSFYGSWTNVGANYNATSSSRKIYFEGLSVGNDSPANPNFQNINYSIGKYNDPMLGLIEEVRVSNIERSSSWMKTEHYDLDNNLLSYGSEEIGDITYTPDLLSLDDTWNFQTNPDNQSISDSLLLNDTWNLQPNPDSQNVLDSLSLSDNWLFHDFGTVYKKFQTNLYTILVSSKKYFTDLRIVFNSTKKFNTKLYTQILSSKAYNTDLRLKYAPIDSIVIGTLDDFIVKLDGIELADIDYNSLMINLNLNTTPSNAQFTLSRRHDDLDKMLNGTSSIITAENKIEVFDGTRKLFTGYISEIEADSTRDVVKITALDCRFKMSRDSMELKYGGAWRVDSNHNGIADEDDNTDAVAFGQPDYIRFEKNINTAFIEVMNAVGSLISGYDSLPFPGSFVPEFIKVEKDYISLIDDLIRQTANCNWYVDENERLRFQKVGLGTIKSLPLASLNLKRGPYDLIIDDIQINKPSSSYVKSLVVKGGKNIIQTWATQTFRGWINSDFITFMNSLKEKTTFVFHQRGTGSLTMNDPEGGGNGPYYTGMNGLAISYYNSNEGGWISYPSIIVQWLVKNSSLNRPDFTVGSGLPTKTLYLTSYGKKVSNYKWGEEIKVGTNPNNGGGMYGDVPKPDLAYLTWSKEENYDYTQFLTDLANFELNQNNKLQSTAKLSLLLDAYEYYNLSFMDLINLSNTIQSGIYSNNNGFPLNIDNIQINCATRVVNLSLTNYNKSWYVKTSNYMVNNIQPFFQYVERKWIWVVITASGERLTTE